MTDIPMVRVTGHTHLHPRGMVKASYSDNSVEEEKKEKRKDMQYKIRLYILRTSKP